jgi:hypothetical protein
VLVGTKDNLRKHSKSTTGVRNDNDRKLSFEKWYYVWASLQAYIKM